VSPETVLFLTNTDCAKLIDLRASLSLMRGAFRDLGLARSKAPAIPRSRVVLNSKGNSKFLLTIMSGSLPSSDYVACRSESGIFIPDKNRVNLEDRSSLILLYKRSSGKLISVLQGDYISLMRVPATTALATSLLANENVRNMAMIGSGKMAEAHLEAICLVRKPKSILAYSPNSSRLAEFCFEMTNRIGIEVQPRATSRLAVLDADIVTVATSSKRPTFDGNNLKDGSHVNSILSSDRIFRGQDVDDATYRRADLIVVNSRNQASLDNQTALLMASRNKRIVELEEVVARKRRGRISKNEVTLYDNNTGLGAQFAAICGYITEQAVKSGIGRNLRLIS
jgi:alanine dehydrogenase